MAQFLPYVVAAAGVASAAQTRKAGIVASNEAKMEAKQEGDAARAREIERRRDLLRAIANQNARAGAMGVTTGGSIGGMIKSDINDARNDLLVDTANTRNRQRALRIGGRNSVKAGNAAAVSSLLDTAAKAYGAS